MTPPAATVAGRHRGGPRTARSSRPGGARARPARRVSGPARPAPGPPREARAAAPRPSRSRARSAAPAGDRPIVAFGGRLVAAAAAALPQRAPLPSAPARPRPRAVPRPARRPDRPLGERALDWLRALPDHRLLDRLIGGRIWIVLLGTLLVGIVTMQLSLLRLNAGIGQAVEKSTALEQRNAALRLQISQLSDGERIVALATQLGYVTPPQGSPRFLTANGGDAAKALTTMRVPDPNAVAAATTVAAADTTAIDPAATPVDATSTDATATDPAASTTDPAAAATDPTTTPTTTDPAATAPTTGTTAPATGTTAPATGTTAPITAAGGAAAAPTGTVGPQG